MGSKKICKYCSCEFESKSARGEYCSPKCQRTAYALVHREQINARRRGHWSKLSQAKKDQIKEKNSERQKAKIEKYRADDARRHRNVLRRLREETFLHYGSRCATCGEPLVEFLCIDHINDDGAEHRKAVGDCTARVLKDLKRRDWPEGVIQYLCYNCNAKKEVLRQKRTKATPTRLIHDAIIDKYGGKCSCCGCNDKDILQIHPLGGKSRDILRKLGDGNPGTGRTRLLTKLYRESISSDYRILCPNCNRAILYYGECPHHYQSNETSEGLYSVIMIGSEIA